MNYLINFLSKRNVPLVLNHLPEKDHPLITIENWTEWEESGLYVVYDDGMSQAVLDDKFLNKQFWDLAKKYKQDSTPTFEMSTKVWNPDFIIDLANEMAFDIDEVSFDLIYGRWMKKLSGMYV